MTMSQSPIEGISNLPLAWDGDFAAQIGCPPVEAVDMIAHMEPDRQAQAIAEYSVAYAGDASGDAYALALSGTPTEDFDGQLATGQRAVVACAPLDASLDGWHMGVAEPYQRLGIYQQPEWLLFPAVALPVAAGGLQVWIGRLRRQHATLDPPMIDRTRNSGLNAQGVRLSSVEGVLRPLSAATIRRLCPGAVFIQPPIQGED